MDDDDRSAVVLAFERLRDKPIEIEWAKEVAAYQPLLRLISGSVVDDRLTERDWQCNIREDTPQVLSISTQVRDAALVLSEKSLCLHAAESDRLLATGSHRIPLSPASGPDHPEYVSSQFLDSKRATALCAHLPCTDPE